MCRIPARQHNGGVIVLAPAMEVTVGAVILTGNKWNIIGHGAFSVRNMTDGMDFSFVLLERSLSEGATNPCMSVQARNTKTIVPIDLIFYPRSIIPVVRSSSKIIRIGIRMWTQEFTKDS